MLKVGFLPKNPFAWFTFFYRKITSAPECDENVLLSMPKIQQDEIE